MLTALLIGLCASAITVNKAEIRQKYSKREVMIPMRDGVRLSTAIYEPAEPREGGSPVIMMRTPYGLRPYGEEFTSNLFTYFANYVSRGYIVVYQSVRGTYLSEGEFENIRPVGEGGCDDASDCYDTIEWLLQNCRTNGRVGVKGSSYPGFYATVAALCAHPALKAVSPQAPVGDWFKGDDFQHNGALMMADCYSFGGGFLPPRVHPSEDGGKISLEGCKVEGNLYDHFLSKGSVAEAFRPWSDKVPFWNAMKAHRSYDSFWERRDPSRHFGKDMPAIMIVGGLFDAEDCYGPLYSYRRLLESKGREDVYLVEGPWDHGGWKKSEAFLDEVEYPFFARYLEGREDLTLPPVTLLASRDSVPDFSKGGIADGEWEKLDSWPDGRGRKLYLNVAERSLDEKSPCRTRKALAAGYISDPENPIPYYEKVFVQKKRDKAYMASDQSWVEGRSDLLCFKGEPQRDTLRLVGPLRVGLKLRQSSPDADYIVLLLDEWPDGRQMLIRGDVMPARFRKGFDRLSYVKADRKFSLEFSLNDIAHYLMPGHRLVLHIQSSWYPLVAMNPQSAPENDLEAEAEDYKKARISVLEGSWIEIPAIQLQ